MSTHRHHLLVMAGGTGGHIFPALAVAKLMLERGVKVTWLGTRKGLESKIVPANNIEIQWITIEGLRGKGLSSWLLAPFKLLRAIWQSFQILRGLKPDCVLGMGGFASGPGGLAAWLSAIPLVIHEQNAVAGLTNKYLAKLANRVLTGFPKVADLPAHATWVGNPVRDEISNITAREANQTRATLRVLVIGGSQGAHSFNVQLPKAFAAHSVALDVWHQTGKGHQQSVQRQYQENNFPAKVSEFIEDMAGAYKWADFLVCRAGAMTIAECCAAGKPALLVPYPHSAGNHQDRNADFMVAAGAAVVLNNAQLASSDLQAALHRFTHPDVNLVAMSKAAKSLHKSAAATSVTEICEEFFHA